MAGAEFAKYGTASGAEMQVHFDDAIRGDKRVNHSNQSIDTSRTHLNYTIGGTYSEIMERVYADIERADSLNPPKRVRKDRKTIFTLEVPIPHDLTGSDANRFVSLTFDMFKDYLPGLEGAFIHRDEVHEYYDPRKKEIRTSMEHIHFIGAGITEDGRCNMKDFITPQLCQKVNDDLQALCLREWGISYQTGEGRSGSKKTVEQLKAESEVALQETLAKEGLTHVDDLREQKDMLEDSVESLKKEVNNAENILYDRKVELNDTNLQISKKKTELKSLDNQIKNKKNIIDTLNDALANLFTRFNKAYTALQRIIDHWFNHEEETYKKICDRMREPVNKGNRAMTTLFNANQMITNKEALTPKIEEDVNKAHEDLKDATEELEQIEEDFDFER